jgi:uncharacterized membrane protein (DUF2068 family)
VTPREALPDDLAGESRFQLLTRLGFAARGVLYILIAALVILAGRTEDLTGALEYLNHGLGTFLLALLAVGMAVYGVWRLADAAFGIESGRHRWKAWRKRIASATSGAIYLLLSYKAVRILTEGRFSGDDPQEQTAEALHLPGGEIIVFVAAAIMLGAGIAQFFKVASCNFLHRLDCTDHQKSWIKWLGRVGYTARGLVFLVIGWLLARAAISHQASGAGGLEQALDAFSNDLQGWIAGGLALFGIMSLVEARYRRIHRPPPVEKVAEKISDAVKS